MTEKKAIAWDMESHRKPIETGSFVMGDWEVLREIGEGAYGRVFEIGKTVYGIEKRSALKVISIPKNEQEYQQLAMEMDEESVTQYLTSVVDTAVAELNVMMKLSEHPGIMRCEDFAVVQYEEDNSWDIFMRLELLESLPAYLKRKGTLAPEEITRLGEEICTALSFCEGSHVMHRDVKPENIFISKSGNFKLGDFGMARIISESTMASSQKGTELYMAPEIIRGEKYGGTVDTYALGLVLYRLLNDNLLPFYPKEKMTIGTREQAFISRMKGEKMLAPAHADAELSGIVLKACAFRPEDRYQSAEEMRAAIAGYRGGSKKEDMYLSLSHRSMTAETTEELSALADAWEALCYRDSAEMARACRARAERLAEARRKMEENERRRREAEAAEAERKRREAVEAEQRKKKIMTVFVSVVLICVFLAICGVMKRGQPTSTVQPDATEYVKPTSTVQPDATEYVKPTSTAQPDVTEYVESTSTIQPSVKAEDIKDNLAVMEKCIVRLETNTHKFLSTEGTDVDWTSLKESEYYSPYLLIKNESGADVSFSAILYIDDNRLTYNSMSLVSGGTHWLWVREDDCEKYLTKGLHTLKWFINDELFASTTVTVRGQRQRVESTPSSTPTPHKMVKVGDTLYFGHYEQNKENQKEPIEWRVLEVRDNKALLISRYALDYQPYNKLYYNDITWETCSLRTWLNYEFLNNAFSADEQKAILMTEVDNSDSQSYRANHSSGGNSTNDQIFLLSYAEVCKYFADDAARMCAPTDYAVSKGGYTSAAGRVDGKATGLWWLRSPGMFQNYVTIVNDDGSLDLYGYITYLHAVVRPAFWVNLESEIFQAENSN